MNCEDVIFVKIGMSVAEAERMNIFLKCNVTIFAYIVKINHNANNYVKIK